MRDERFNLLGISDADWKRTPESVRLAVHALLEIVQVQSAQIKELQTRVRDLEAKLGQTSRNSSKPPSSDPPSAPPTAPSVPRGRNAGGQPGHPGHQRPLVPPDQVDEAIELLPDHCPRCHTALAPNLPPCGAPRRTQVWELPALRPHITEYRQHSRCCPLCQEVVVAALPADAPPGAFGPRATAFMAILRGRYRLSLDDVVELLHDVWQLPISSGCLVTSCARVSVALAPVDAAIHCLVQRASQLNIDETSWPTETRSGWLWVAVADDASCFRIHPSRGQGALRQLVGECYRGIVGSDRYSAYAQFPDAQRQVCWAHIKRNVLGLADRYGTETGWAQTLGAQVDAVFLAWQLYKGGWVDQVGLQQALLPLRWAVREQLQRGTESPYAKIARFSRELLARWAALWTFSRVAGVEPTNNAAERALRHAVLWRKGSFGSRSASGCRFVERMLSVYATCRQQARSLFTVVTAAVQAAWTGTPAPVLVAPPASP